MEQELHEAAINGNLESLLNLLEQDPLILHKLIVSCISQTPLHTAATLNHVDFTRHLLSTAPQLATESDSRASTPLHLASAKGHLEIVKLLLSADYSACFSRNTDGLTPLHLAVVKGRIGVLTELVRVVPESTRVLTDLGQSVLHLCVVYRRLDALILLFGCCKKDLALLNLRDHDGNTLLHLSVARKQIEIIKFLLAHTGMEINALNLNGFTPLDILNRSPRHLDDMKIRDALKNAGALRAEDLPKLVQNLDRQGLGQKSSQPILKLLYKSLTQKPKEEPDRKHVDWLGRKRSSLMVVASLIATVAFQAVVSPPGGVWPDEVIPDITNPNVVPHHVGTSILAYTQPRFYGQFMILNTLSFLSSLSIILLFVSGLPLKRKRWMWLLLGIMSVSISSLAVTYLLTLINTTPDTVQKVLYHVTKIFNITWLGLITIILVIHVTRIVLWLLRKYKLLKNMDLGHHLLRDDTLDDDDDDI